jgi:hypothetical protein
MRLPDHVFATLQRVAAKYPGPRPHDDYALVLNEVAWVHRAEGFGLSEKTGGTRVHHPILGDMAEDILQLPDGTHWDVFASAGDGRPLQPTQGPAIVPNTPRRWLAPVKPGEVIIPGPSVPPPVPPTCRFQAAPLPPPPPPPDLEPLEQALARAEAALREQHQMLAALSATIVAIQADLVWLKGRRVFRF